MAKSVTITHTTAKKLIQEIERFEEMKVRILRLIPEELIPYGSKLWWEKEILEAEKEIRSGKFKELHSVDDIDKPLNKLFA